MSESLEKLRNRILSDAKLKADDTLRDANERAGQVRREAREKAEREASDLLARAEADAEAVRRSIISSRIRANRLRLLEERNKIVQNVLSDVQQRLLAIATTANFQDVVKRLATEAVDAIGSDHPVVKIGFPKASGNKFSFLADALPKDGLVVYDDKLTEELGGVVASDSQGNIAYRNTFRARLDRFDRELLTLISSTIFGEQRLAQREEVEAPAA